MKNNQIHEYAIKIESLLKNIFNCERGGFGGQINSDIIQKHPYLSITQGLAYLYVEKKEKQSEIDTFLDDFSFLSELDLDTILNTNNQDLEKFIEIFKNLIK